MANLTPVEQDDNATITRLEITDPVLGYDPGNPGAGDGKANEQAQKIANTLLFLRRRVGVQGNWDMTGSSADVVPVPAGNVEMTTATVSAAQYTATPVNGSTLIKMAASGTITKPSDARSARLRASTSGGNFVLSAMAFANSDATAADVAASFGAGCTGTCTHLAIVMLDNSGIVGPGAMKIAVQTDDPVNANATEVLIGAGAYSALDQVYITFDGATGFFSVSVNAGAPVAGTNSWNVSAAAGLKAYVIGYHSANPPSLPDGSYDFDFSDNTSGRVGFQTAADPAVPSGAADGKRYLVTVAGSYAGRSAGVGDIVEFHTALAAIQIIPATPWTTALIQALINPYITANPSAVQALIDASLLTFIPSTIEFDVETDYALVGGANPGEFQLSADTLGATFWSSNAAGAFTLLDNYGAGYTPSPGDTFFVQLTQRNQVLDVTPAGGTPGVRVATDWDFGGYTSYVVEDFMKTALKRYQFTFKYVDGVNDRWVLMNPDLQAWSNTTVSGAPLITTITRNQHGRPGTAITVESTGNGEVYIPLTTEVATSYNTEPFKIGQSCTLIIKTNTTRLRIMGNSSAAGGITFTSNLPVQSIVVGPVNEPAVDIVGVGHAITITYQGNETWHIFAPTAEEQAVGHLHMSANATSTAIAIAGTYYKVAGTTTGALLEYFTHSNNRLTYTGLAAKKVEVNVAASVVAANNNQTFGIQLAVNGSVVAGSKMRAKLLAAGDPVNIGLTDAISLNNGDYVELFVTNETAANALTVEDLQMTIGGVR